MARPPSDISERILHAARARFLHEGVDGASLRNIAQDADTNIGMIYYHYKTKDELFLAVVEEVYAQLLGDIERALAADVDVQARIGRLYARVAAMSAQEFDIIRLIARESMVSSDRLARLAERFSRGHLPIVFATLAQGFADGALRTDLQPFAIFAAVLSLAIAPQMIIRLGGPQIEAHTGRKLPPASALSEMLSQVLFQGISAKNASAADLETDDERAALKRLPRDEERNAARSDNRKKR